MFGQRASTPYKGWTYDDLGNHLTQDDNGSTIAGLFNDVNEQTQRGATNILWDKNGNLTKDDGSASGGSAQAYSYDRQNMLTRVEDAATSSLTEQYKYDALGRRIVADGGTNVVRFYHSGNQIIEETNGSDTVQRTYVWGPIYIDELILFEDTAGNGGTAGAGYFALRHHNYNVVALADSSGTIVERYDYNPYGQRFVLNADFSADADGLSDYANSIGHQGLHHDTATGLVYNRARMLAPVLGRFMQRDPMGYVDGMSVYMYLHSMPLLLVDSSGMTDWWGVVGNSLGAAGGVVEVIVGEGLTDTGLGAVVGVPLMVKGTADTGLAVNATYHAFIDDGTNPPGSVAEVAADAISGDKDPRARLVATAVDVAVTGKVISLAKEPLIAKESAALAKAPEGRMIWLRGGDVTEAAAKSVRISGEQASKVHSAATVFYMAGQGTKITIQGATT